MENPIRLVVAVAALTLSCGSQDRSVLASWDGGHVDEAALSSSLQTIPPEAPVTDWEQEARSRLETLALDRCFLKLIQKRPELRPQVDQLVGLDVRSRAMVAAVTNCATRIAPPSEDRLRAMYQDALAKDNRIRRRFARHIFKRRVAGMDDQKLTIVASELRDRLQRGAAFATVATEESDSQSRHFAGNLGWFREDDPSDLARTFFELEVGVISKPMVTAEGVHLFQVTEEEVPEPIDFEDRRSEWIVEARRQDLLVSFRELILNESFSPLQAVDKEILADAVEQNQTNKVVFESEGFKVTVGDVQALRQDAKRMGLGSTVEGVCEYLNLRERARDWFLQSLPKAERSNLLLNAETKAVRRIGLAAFLDESIGEEELQAYYERQKNRFSSNIELRLLEIVRVVGEGDNANQIVADLEQFHAQGHSESDFRQLAIELGVEIQELGWSDHQAVADRFPAALGKVLKLQPMQTSPPILRDGSVRMMYVLERREPEPLPYHKVSQRVRHHYINSQLENLGEESETRLLKDRHFKINEARLQEFIRRLMIP